MLPTTINYRLCRQLISRTRPGTIFAFKWDCSSRRNYAKPAISGIAGLGKKKLGKAGPVIEKKVLPVETDTEKLVTHCCGLDYRKEGKDPKLGDDSEYPDWLWTLNTGDPIPIEQLDPNTDEYWDRVTEQYKKRLRSLQRIALIK